MQLQSNRFPLKDSDYLNRQVINNIPITNAIPQKIIKTSKIDKILLLTTRTEVNIDELSPQNRILELMNQNISLGECEKEIKSLINSLSIKTLHTIKSLIKPDNNILIVLRAFLLMFRRVLKSNEITEKSSWKEIKIFFNDPQILYEYLKSYKSYVQSDLLDSRYSYQLFQTLDKDFLDQEKTLISEIITKIFKIVLFLNKYIELYQQSPDKIEFQVFKNEFLEDPDERPSVLTVCPSQKSEFEVHKSSMIEKSGKKIEKSDIKSEKKPRMKDLILNRIKAFPNRNNNLWSEQIENKSRSKTRNKSEKPNKLERIMQIKIKKPKVLSVVKTYICEKNEFQIRKKSKSPLIEKKIIEEDINCLKKDINKIDKHQNKLEFIFAKEKKKIEEYQSLKRRNEEKKIEIDLVKTKLKSKTKFKKDKKFKEVEKIKQQEEKIKKKELQLSHIESIKARKSLIQKQKELQLQEEIERNLENHKWLQIERHRSKSQHTQEKVSKLENIEFARSAKRLKKEQETQRLTEELKQTRENSLRFEHRKMISKKEELEKTLEKTLSVIMKIRESYKDLNL